jgi:hypothetical protein
MQIGILVDECYTWIIITSVNDIQEMYKPIALK